MTEPHRYTFTVCYGDSDAAGVLYYARYLYHSERARLEWMNQTAYNWKEMHIKDRVIFPVWEVKIVYKKPIFLGDSSCIHTWLKKAERYHRIVEHVFFNEKQERCTSCWVKVVCVKKGQLVPINKYFS